MTTDAELARYLQSQLHEWCRSHTFGPWRDDSHDCYFPLEQRPSVSELAQAFLEDAEFRALKIAGLFTTPEGEFFAAALEQVSPPFLRPDEKLIMDALTLAVKMQRQGRQQAGLVALGALLLAGLLAWVAAIG